MTRTIELDEVRQLLRIYPRGFRLEELSKEDFENAGLSAARITRIMAPHRSASARMQKRN